MVRGIVERLVARRRGRRAPVSGRPAPSADSVTRLERRMRRERTAHRARLDGDLTEIDRLLEAGHGELASEVLAEYERVLRAYTAQIEGLVAEAVLVRDAEEMTASVIRRSPARRAASVLAVADPSPAGLPDSGSPDAADDLGGEPGEVTRGVEAARPDTD